MRFKLDISTKQFRSVLKIIEEDVLIIQTYHNWFRL